jgi:hypothetical protein
LAVSCTGRKLAGILSCRPTGPRTIARAQKGAGSVFQRTYREAHGRKKRTTNSVVRFATITGSSASRSTSVETAVRNFERAGVPRATAMAMVGHKTESIYRRYSMVDQAMLSVSVSACLAVSTATAARQRRDHGSQEMVD